MGYIGIRLLDDLDFESRYGQDICLSLKRPDRLGRPHSQLFHQYRGSFSDSSAAQSVGLTIYLHPVLTLRTNATIHSTRLCLYSVDGVKFTSVLNMPLFFYVHIRMCTKFQYLLSSSDATCRKAKF